MVWEEGLWNVAAILGKEKRKNKVFYKVHWEGFPVSEATWEPPKNIPGHFIKAFNKKMSKK